jgi:hypothetical protein
VSAGHTSREGIPEDHHGLDIADAGLLDVLLEAHRHSAHRRCDVRVVRVLIIVEHLYMNVLAFNRNLSAEMLAVEQKDPSGRDHDVVDVAFVVLLIRAMVWQVVQQDIATPA